MIAKVNRKNLAVFVLVVAAIGGLGWNVFAGTEASRKTARESRSTVTSDSSTQFSGQELWSMNCQRCHNLRSPTMYSDAQWDVIVHHMRVRANITGAEQRAIADFLKSFSSSR
jgi:nitrate/TMAO reductase-like tetraheme cytochrome c subunit